MCICYVDSIYTCLDLRKHHVNLLFAIINLRGASTNLNKYTVSKQVYCSPCKLSRTDSINFCADKAVCFVDMNLDDGLDNILSQALDMLRNKSSKMTENYGSFYDSSRKGQYEHLLMTEFV